MKKIFALFTMLLTAVMGVNAQSWDFTKTPDADVRLLSAATTEWSYTESSNRYESITAINGAITAGGTELEMTKGLAFEAAAKKIRIDVNNRLQLAGKNITVTTPALKKGLDRYYCRHFRRADQPQRCRGLCGSRQEYHPERCCHSD